MKIMYFTQISFFSLILTVLFAATANTQTTRTPAAGPTTSKVEAFQKAFKTYSATLEKAKALQEEYKKEATTNQRREEIGEELSTLAERVGKYYPQMLKIAEAAWLEKPEATPELISFITEVIEIRLSSDNYERAYPLLQGMLTTDYPKKLPEIYDVAGEVCFMLNEYGAADNFFKQAKQKDALSERGEAWQKEIPYYKIAWAGEKTLRAREQAAGDLPRVLLKTTKGDITLELFENNAPNTVANFISLVEKKFYDGSPFHRVISGFMAQTGVSAQTGAADPGYHIACEASKPGARKHFRGSVSMAITDTNTGGSQFYICFIPRKELDSVNTVFGRVVSGWDALSELMRIDPQNPDPMAEPDIIVSATVLRKRDHEYKPQVIRQGAAGKASGKTTKNAGPSAYQD